MCNFYFTNFIVTPQMQKNCITCCRATPSAPTPTPGNPRPSANAWTRPLQSANNNRSKATTSDVNGLSQGSRLSSSTNYTGSMSSVFDEPSPNGKEAVQNVLRERFLHLTLSMIGQRVTLTLTNGSIIEGIFHTFTPFDNQPQTKKNVYVIKACKSIQGANVDEENKKEDSPDIEVTNGCTLLIPADKVSNLHVKSMRLETVSLANNAKKGGSSRTANNGNHNSVDFRTDTEISRGGLSKGEELIAAGSAWTSTNEKDSRSNAASASLESSTGLSGRKGLFGTSLSSSNGNASASENLSGSIGEWDQFSANEKLTQKKATFDENIYTTQLDKTKIDTRKIEEAERLAREIEGTTSANIHIAEERGHKLQGDYDEEDLYSGVLSSGSKVRMALAVSKKKDTKSSSESDPRKVEEKSSDTKSIPSGDQKKESEPAPTKTSTTAKTVMNYAAAAAKADTTGVPTSTTTEQKTTLTTTKLEKTGKHAKTDATDKLPSKAKSDHTSDKDNKSIDKKPKSAAEEGASKGKADVATPGQDAEEKTSDETSKETATSGEEKATEESTPESAKPKVASKLNANAKAFTFNPSAKSFTPSVSTNTASTTPSQTTATDQQMGVPAANAPGMPGMAHYMHHPQMAQPGMMPMMNAHYATNVRYQAPYTMMSQHGVQIPQQSPQVQGTPVPTPQQPNTQAPQSDGQGTASEGDDQSANAQTSSVDSNQSESAKQGSEAQVSQQNIQAQQQGVPVAYSMSPASGYYANGIPIQQHARGGVPNMAYPPMVGTHQQIPVSFNFSFCQYFFTKESDSKTNTFLLI